MVALAKREGVEVRLYNVIYELLDDVRDAMTGMLAPDEKEKILGQAQVRQIFELSNKQRVAGCMIVKGRVNAKSRIRVRRGGCDRVRGAHHEFETLPERCQRST